MRASLLFTLVLVVGGCAPTRPRPNVAYAPRPAPPVVPAPVPQPADWRDLPATPGAWTYVADARGSLALFGPAGADALAVLRCDRANRRLFLSRAGAATGPFTVRTSSATRQLVTGATGGDPPYVAAVLPATDPLLDAMAFSRGRFALEQPGAPPLALPAWAEVGRVVEDCRG